MRIGILGAGSTGLGLAALLGDVNEVTLLVKPHQVPQLVASTVVLSGVRNRSAAVRVAVPSSGLDLDLVILAVKAYDTVSALRALSEPGNDHISLPVLSFQNGLRHPRDIQFHCGERFLLGTISHGMRRTGPLEVEHTGEGDLVVGDPTGRNAGLLRQVVDALTEAGLVPQVSTDILGALWRKAIVNSAINPLTAITGLPNGAILEVPRLRTLAHAVVSEGVEVAVANGQSLEADQLVADLEQVASATASNTSSMLQDIQRGRPTEVGAINGELAERGRQRGVAAPLNDALVALVESISLTTRYDAPGPVTEGD